MSAMIVPTSSLVAMALAVLFCLLLPIAALVRWHRREGARWLPALLGAVTFLVFSQGLEGILHYFCLVRDSAVSRAIWWNPWLYMLYGAFAAGIFEECGRYVMYKTVLRRADERSVAVTAGIGHGGIEAILLAALPTAAYLALGILWNAGDVAALTRIFGELSTVETMVASLEQYTVGYCVLLSLERVSAMALHVALSIFVFQAARGKRGGLLFAIALHTIFDMPAALYQVGVLRDLAAVELWLIVVALFALRSARKCYLEECDI